MNNKAQEDLKYYITYYYAYNSQSIVITLLP